MISLPDAYDTIVHHAKQIGFDMQSDLHAGMFLRVIAASKKSGNFLELGTGLGLSTSWLLDGMDSNSKLMTVENDLKLAEFVNEVFSNDSRLTFIADDASNVILTQKSNTFDLIFADTWVGKYSLLNETLALLKVGGVYLIDDMLPQPNWSEGHEVKVQELLKFLERCSNMHICKIGWSSGLVYCVRTA